MYTESMDEMDNGWGRVSSDITFLPFTQMHNFIGGTVHPLKKNENHYKNKTFNLNN